MKLSVQYKLTLLFTGVMAIILLSIMVIMYNISSTFRKNNYAKSLEDRAILLTAAYQNPEFQEVLLGLKEKNVHRITKAEDFIFEIDALEKPMDLPVGEAFLLKILNNGSSRTFKDGKAYAGISFSTSDPLKNFIAISVSEDIQGNAYRQKLKATLASAFLVAIFSMAIISLVFSRKLVTPVMKMIQSLNNIDAFNLSTRLDKGGFADEITDLKDTINEMMERIDGAFKTQQKFIGDTTHSLRTPLTIILGEVEIAQTQLDPKHKAYYSLEMIQQEAEKLNQLVTTLLDMAKNSSTKNQRDWGIIKLNELINNVCKTILRMDSSYKLKIDFPTQKLPLIKGNKGLLNLALSNIILNGIKYSDGDTVKIKFDIEPTKINIKIIDKGIGIPKKDLDKVFIPYYRSSNTEGIDGFGIGLPLTMDIIRMHSGDIKVESIEGYGSIFTVELPLIKLSQ